MIEKNPLTVKPPNVQANTFLDHGSSLGPSINMISIRALGEDEGKKEESAPFVINYVPTEIMGTVMGSNAAPEPFVIEVPTKTVNKRKAHVVEPAIPKKKVTKEEAEAFMKVIKASEYKMVEQMGKFPSHISLLAHLLNLEPHRKALLKVLTAAQVPKETALDWIEETVGSIF
ncbi:hypothetical protein CRG98_038464 [Punica granatum]|uniref:Uncharacterized protein n=1 Tax=Punica granatum TaxID=22663 RepID=A0A2I0IAX5_PUNGR|nr:hypothetical protein CRG98_038464 [Punica granatum]